jgi:hypothetical protein
MTNKEIKFDDDNFNLQNNHLANNFSETMSNIPSQNNNQLLIPNDSVVNTNFYCEPCNLKLNSRLIYQQHLSGIKHKKKVNQIELINQYNK